MSYNHINHDYDFGPTYNFQPQIYNQPRTARHNLSSFNGNQPNPNISLARIQPSPNSFRERNNISNYENRPQNSFNPQNVYQFENKSRVIRNPNNYHHGNFASFSQNNHAGDFPSFNLPNQKYQLPPSLPFLNLENVKHRKVQHSKSQNHYTPQIPSFSNLDQNSYGTTTTIETHLDKQNKVLSQIQGMLARQNQFDQQKHKVEMAQRIKELQYDRLVVHQELERQKSTRLQVLIEANKPEKFEEKKIIKKEKSGMKDIILDLILNRAKKRNKTPIQELDTPSTVTLKHYNSERKAYHQKDIPIFSSQSQKTRTAIINQENHRIFRTNSNAIFNAAVNPLDRNSILSLQDEEEDTSIQYDLNLNPLSGSKNSIESVEEDEGFKSVKRSRVKKQKTKRYNKTKSLKSFKSAILEEDDYEIVKEQKRKKARYRLMSMSWLLLYGKLLYQEKKKTTLSNREMFDSKISSIIGQIHQIFYENITQSAGKEILNMFKDTNHSYIFTDPLVKQKKSEQKSAALLTHLNLIFHKLIIQVSLMPDKVFDLLKHFLMEDRFLPNDYFTSFELNRIKFGAFGTIREMHSGRMKLLIGSIFLTRIVLHSIIMHPWDAFNQSKTKFKIEKILNIGSILYHTIMIVLKSTVPSYQNNQSFLSLDLKVRPKKKLLQAIDDPHAENVFHIEKDQSKDGDIIDGFYAKHQLRTFFEDTKPRFEELKSLINICLDTIYERFSVIDTPFL